MASSRIHGADYFDDVRSELGGILESKGLDDYDNIDTSVKQPGVETRLNCWGCGRPRVVLLEWPELIAVASLQQGSAPVLPAGWRYSPNNQTAYVGFNCGHCGQAEGISVHTTPEEARQHVQRGLNAGFVTQQQIQGVQQKMLPYRR